MPDLNEENQRFIYVNHDDPSEHDHSLMSTNNNNNVQKKPNSYAASFNIMGLDNGLGWRASEQATPEQQQQQEQESRIVTTQQPSQEQKQKDRRIRKLTNINKHLLQQLKEQNDELTKRVNKQKFRIPKKSVHKQAPKNEQTAKQLQAIKRQLQNSYRQIEFYKQTIQSLKAREMPLQEKSKVNELLSKLHQKNDDIQKIQAQIRTQRAIKAKQDKQLEKIENNDLTDMIRKIDQQIQASKTRMKEAKRTLNKRQQLEKKQHVYCGELEALVKRRRQEEEKREKQEEQGEKHRESEGGFAGKKLELAQHEEITESQWKAIKEKLVAEKKKYEEYGKKITYHNYMRSKQSKLLQELDLKHKEKAKTLQKLTSKLQQVNKLARLVPKPQILQRVDLKMQKLKDIISRQNTIELSTNPNNNSLLGNTPNNARNFSTKQRVQSDDVRQFKRWELEHAARDNDVNDNDIKGGFEIGIKYRSDKVGSNRKMGEEENNNQELEQVQSAEYKGELPRIRQNFSVNDASSNHKSTIKAQLYS